MPKQENFLNGLIRNIISLKVVSTKLRKDLGLLEVFCISSGAMISSGLFILIAIAFTKTGPSVIVSYLIASLLVIPTVLAKAELVTAMPKTGGIFVFTDRTMGPIMGTLAGLAAWFSLSFKTAFALLGIGIFASIINPSFSLWQEKLFAIGFCIVFMLINLYGVKLTGRFQSFMVLMLLAILSLYIGKGIFSVELSRFSNFAPAGLRGILATAGLVFISFAGTTKIASVAGEVKDPGRNLPLGIILSWAIVSIFYIATIFVTIGIMDNNILSNTLTPISMGGSILMGRFGLIIMSMAAIFAFITTGNAGILSASRNPMAMAKAGLLPGIFEKVSKRKTPDISIISTSIFMIAAILFLDLELFIKTASTLKLILFIIANVALIVVRRSNLKHYQPSFRAPFSPLLQIIGIIGYIILIIDMGAVPLILTGVFVLISLLWYLIYAHHNVKKEYYLIDIIKRTADIGPTSYLEDEELREVLIDENKEMKKQYTDNIKSSIVIDLENYTPLKEIYRKAADGLSKSMDIKASDIQRELMQRESKGHIIGKEGYSIIFSPVPGKDKFNIAMIRAKQEIKYSYRFPPARAFFIVVASSDIQHFYLKTLMWLVETCEEKEFLGKWLSANNEDQLKDVMIGKTTKDINKYVR